MNSYFRFNLTYQVESCVISLIENVTCTLHLKGGVSINHQRHKDLVSSSSTPEVRSFTWNCIVYPGRREIPPPSPTLFHVRILKLFSYFARYCIKVIPKTILKLTLQLIFFYLIQWDQRGFSLKIKVQFFLIDI